MRNKIAFFLLIFGFLGMRDLKPVQAQMGTVRFNFRDRAQVKKAVLSNLKNPRTTYDILICAARQGFIGTALQTYEGLMAKRPFNATPEIKSAYALSHHLTLYPQLWFWKRELAPGLVSAQWGNVGKVTYFRDEALTSLPRAPEVLLGHAIWLNSLSGDGPSKALKMVERALRIAPEWADLHYWHARILVLYAANTPSKQWKVTLPRYFGAALKALDKAEKLDPKFRQEDLVDRIAIYENLGRPREALEAFDAYVRYRPGWIKWDGQKETRARLVAAVAKLDRKN